MNTSTKIGTLTPVIYFERADGHVMLAPYSECPPPDGYIRCGADTLSQIDKLVDRLRAQEHLKFDRAQETEDQLTSLGRQRITDSLMAKLVSSETTEYDKDFIRAYLQLRAEKRDKHRSKFESQNFILYAREFDLHGRDAALEKK